MPVANAVVERLIAQGRRTGTLDPADLAAAISLDRLSVLDLADLIDRLEEADVAVEIDPRLLVARAPVPQDQILVAANADDGPTGIAARIGVFARPDARDGLTATTPHDAPGPIGHGHRHGPARAISPTILAIGSMIAAVVLILLMVGGGHAGG